MTDTRDQVRAAVQMTTAVGEAIRSLGEVPSGHLYARLMGVLSLSQYESILGTLKRASLVEEDGSHLLRWIGPKPGLEPPGGGGAG